jgi:hypothetical protein
MGSRNQEKRVHAAFVGGLHDELRIVGGPAAVAE